MKIAFVSDAIFPYNKGGKEKRIFEMTTRLAKRGHDIHLYCMKWWNGPKNKTENGVHLHSLCKNYPLYSGERRSISQAIVFGLACLRLVREDFDVIDVDHMPLFPLFSTKLVCILKRKKMIGTWNEVWGKDYWQEYLGWRGYFGYLIEKFAVLMPNKITAVSRHTKNKLLNDLKINKTIATIPNGIDLNKIQKVKPARRKSDVIFAGRLLSHKNVDVLIKSIKLIKEKYPRTKCFIIGEGPEKEKLENLTKKLSLEKNVKFLDFLENHNDVYALMKSAKVLVLPSTREGFGIAVIEANACGIPVITIQHKDNAAKDLIEEGKNGFICQLNEGKIAEGIIRVLKKSSHKKMKQACIDSAKKFGWNQIVNEIEEVYKA